MARRVRVSTSVALWVCTLASIGLFVGSFLVPPLGAVDPSILKAGAELFAFAGLFVAREAIMEGLGVKVTHGGTSLEIRDPDGIKADPDPRDPTEIKGEYNGRETDPE